MRSAVLGALIACLVIVPSASASEVATPRMYKTPVSHSPGERSYKKIKAVNYRRTIQRFLVLEEAFVGSRRWLKIRLPKRPNGASAWVLARRMTVKKTDAFLVVDLSSRKMSFFWREQRKWQTRVEIGAPKTPTPTGLFAVYDRYNVWRYYPGASYGPWGFDLTAHSNVLKNFAGGEGRIAIHGSASDSWGSANTHGCVRAPDWALAKLRKQLFLGYPVRIKN